MLVDEIRIFYCPHAQRRKFTQTQAVTIFYIRTVTQLSVCRLLFGSFFLTFAQVVNRQDFIDTYTNNVVMFAEREILFNCEHAEKRVGLVFTVISAALISVVLLMYSKACI